MTPFIAWTWRIAPTILSRLSSKQPYNSGLDDRSKSRYSCGESRKARSSLMIIFNQECKLKQQGKIFMKIKNYMIVIALIAFLIFVLLNVHALIMFNYETHTRKIGRTNSLLSKHQHIELVNASIYSNGIPLKCIVVRDSAGDLDDCYEDRAVTIQIIEGQHQGKTINVQRIDIVP